MAPTQVAFRPAEHSLPEVGLVGAGAPLCREAALAQGAGHVCVGDRGQRTEAGVDAVGLPRGGAEGRTGSPGAGGFDSEQPRTPAASHALQN